jgi:hypothetical protein
VGKVSGPNFTWHREIRPLKSMTLMGMDSYPKAMATMEAGTWWPCMMMSWKIKWPKENHGLSEVTKLILASIHPWRFPNKKKIQSIQPMRLAWCSVLQRTLWANCLEPPVTAMPTVEN